MTEEIQEIVWLLEESGQRFAEVLVDAPAAITSSLQDLEGASAIGPIRLMPYSHSTRISVLAKVQSLAVFAWRLGRKRPALLFSGFSMMKHRVMSGLLRVPHLAYLRGVVFDPEVSVGISDRIRFGRLGKLIPRRIVMTYGADQVFTVGPISKEFLVGRGLDTRAIQITGPVWLDPRHLPESTESDRPPTAYFVTTAWQAHGLLEEHAAQLEITRELARTWRGPERLAFRVHPRDLHPYEGDPAFAAVELDRSVPADFLASLRAEDLLLAPLSTLAFEALFLGRRVIFYSDTLATAAYNHVYKRLEITPTKMEAIMAGERPVHSELPDGIFGPIDYEPVRHYFEALDSARESRGS